ncbi:PD-(D/E)XK nuclease family protein [Paralcaligenes ginsengisoli]
MNAMHAPISLIDLAGLPSTETLVLTVNNRYARRMISELSAGLGAERGVMALPDILPLGAWLKQADDQLAFAPEKALPSYALDAFGARQLWQRTIAEAESNHVLLDVAQAARLAMEADRLLSEWRITVSVENETSDYQRFHVWRDLYRARLVGLDAEDGNQAYERILKAIEAGRLAAPFRILILAGFNELSPRFSSLLRGLSEQGVEIRSLQVRQVCADRIARIQASDPDSEWRLAAQWAADSLRQNSQGRYAIVAARLETDVALAHRVLREALGETQTETAAPYNVAVARALFEWPLVRAALAWLEIIVTYARKKYCTPELLGQALLAGYCEADFPESSGRAMIDALWRKKARLRVSNAAFGELLVQFAPRLAQAWQALTDDAARDTGRAAVDTWVRRFRSMLQALGFPGDAALDSHAYQVMEAFDVLLARLGKQAPVLGDIDFPVALGLLRQLAIETPFQPQRDPSARLDVLGFLEAEGGSWDGLWILGLSDEVLPASSKPNPFIPLAALRQANAPRATPERELQWAGDMYEALLCCAPQIWLSHPQHEGERELRPSPFIAELAAQVCTSHLPEQAPALLESLADDQGPALGAGGATKGGIGVIDTQARNPLWAFVKYRLGASQLGNYAEIADQNARGLFLHRAIELVWHMIDSQAALQRLQASARLRELVEESVGQAADECLADYGRVLKGLEVERGIKVLHAWLELELARTPFSVRDVEQTYNWSHGALELSLRLDRIDQLADGRLAIIDYKSGAARIDPKSSWMRPRPVDLQLPFYAAVLAHEDSRVAALILARLHAKQIEVKGLADGDYGFEGLGGLGDWPAFSDYSWERLMNEWRLAIESLAQEYAMGVAHNQIARPADLDYCDVLPFLRLGEEIKHVG